MNSHRTNLIGLTLALILAAPSQAATEIRFGAMTVRKPTETFKEITPLIECLEAGLKKKGLDVKFKTSIGAGEKIRGELNKNELDLIRIVDTTYIRESEDNPKIRLLAAETSGQGIFPPHLSLCQRKARG